MAKPRKRARAVVIGGGVMGCSVAWELARAGVPVLVLERSVPGAEASSAAAGILGAQIEAHAPGPLFELGLASRALYPAWARRLLTNTGIDVEYRACGVVRADFDAASARRTQREYAFQKRDSTRSRAAPAPQALDARALQKSYPALSERVRAGLLFAADARLDPRRLLGALRIAAERAGVVFQCGAYVRRVLADGGRVRGVALDDASVIEADSVVVAAGSWSSLVEGAPLPAGGIVPARGQIVELALPVPLFAPVLVGPRCYLVPRDDGRVLVGSTLEFVGFRREVTAGAVRDLLAAAIELVPALEKASLNASWSSFRPYSPDGLPVIGEAEARGLVIATGHHRNGILLAPITAEIVRALVLRRRPPLDVRPFSPRR